MKIIASHDVDHLYWKDHIFKDMYLPKMFLLSAKQLLSGKINLKTFYERVNIFSDNRVNRINELTAFEESLSIKSTFFFGMNNGLSLSYTQNEVKPFILDLKNRGFDVGVHGIEFERYEIMEKEFFDFQKIINGPCGVRMHYLRQDDSTIRKHSEIGYSFDTTTYKVSHPYQIGNLWEVPLTIMDVFAVRPFHKDLSIAKDYSQKIIQEAKEKNIPYFVINFHDPYFSGAYSIYRDWYIWIINLLKSEGYTFITFSDALKELNK